MKIQAIRIKNLASLDGLTAIDFTGEPLLSAGIFAITGPTGSGKSTLLDALCLALYARTPRYDQAKEMGIEVQDIPGSTINQGDVRGILRDGAGDGFAEVDFVAVDGHVYRANWSIRRAGNKPDGKLQSYTMSLLNTDTKIPVPGKNTELITEIKRLVGLSFEQFTRSVLLAQGDFTAFLKAGKDEKSSLLEKLTGTYIYSEISKKIFERHKAEDQVLRELQQQKLNISTLSDEELDALHNRHLALDSEIKTVQQELEAIGREIAWHERLAELNGAANEARVHYDAAQTAKAESADREQQWQQTERVQETRTWMYAWQQAETRYRLKTEEQAELIKRLDELSAQKIAFQKNLDDTEIQHIQYKKDHELAVPQLAKAKELDTLIEEKARQIANSEKDTEEFAEGYTQHLGQVQEQKNELEILQRAIEKLSAWKNTHRQREGLATHFEGIKSKLDVAKEVLNKVHTAKVESKTIAEKRETIASSGKVLRKSWEEVGIQLTDLAKVIDAQQLVLQEFGIDKVEEEKHEADLHLEQLISAQAHWKVLSAHLLQTGSVEEKIRKNKEVLKNKEAEQVQEAELLKTVQAQREISARSLAKAQLTANESVERLRSQLVDGEACMVCGSTHHPYSQHNPVLDEVLQNLADQHRELEEAYDRSMQLNTRLLQECLGFREAITVGEKELQQLQSSSESLQKTWENFKLPEVNSIPGSQRELFLQQEIDKTKAQQQNIQIRIQSYKDTLSQFERHRETVQNLENQKNQLNNRLKDLEREEGSLLEKLEFFDLEINRNTDSLAETEKSLSLWFSHKDWFTNWKENQDGFVNGLRDFTAQWKQNENDLNAALTKVDILKATLQQMELQVVDLQAQKDKKMAVLTELQSTFTGLTSARSQLFNGEAIVEVERRLLQNIQDAQQKAEELKQAQQRLENEFVRISSQQEQAGKDQAAAKNERNVHHEKISDWLNDYNAEATHALTEAALVKLLERTPEWIATERRFLQHLQETLTKAHSVLGERQNALDQHAEKRGKTRAPDELSEINENARTRQIDLNREHTEIQVKLQQDQENKRSSGHLIHAINKQSVVKENWAKLNDVIGSADGKKFRQVAQEYTLEALLSYANVHLQLLTDRYRIQRIPGTLGLQVTDLDMGNEIRTVYSLSGGESFLVSLALALGLASLSSSRMKVESLFIDEGFGTLDPNTLNIAMDALERLHNQGRKVGVISHVQELTERIPVQIKVKKGVNGGSGVEVVG